MGVPKIRKFRSLEPIAKYFASAPKRTEVIFPVLAQHHNGRRIMNSNSRSADLIVDYHTKTADEQHT